MRLYPPDIEIIDAWAAANPDPDTGLTPSRPTAIRRLIRATRQAATPNKLDPELQPVSRSDLDRAVERILNRLNHGQKPAPSLAGPPTPVSD